MNKNMNKQSPNEFEPFIGKPEVARRLGKTLRTVDNWMILGNLPYYKIGRSIVFKWSEVESHLAQNCRVIKPKLPANTDGHIHELENNDL